MSAIKPAEGKFAQSLPSVLMRHICGFLDQCEVAQATAVSKYWHGNIAAFEAMCQQGRANSISQRTVGMSKDALLARIWNIFALLYPEGPETETEGPETKGRERIHSLYAFFQQDKRCLDAFWPIFRPSFQWKSLKTLHLNGVPEAALPLLDAFQIIRDATPALTHISVELGTADLRSWGVDRFPKWPTNPDLPEVALARNLKIGDLQQLHNVPNLTGLTLFTDQDKLIRELPHLGGLQKLKNLSLSFTHLDLLAAWSRPLSESRVFREKIVSLQLYRTAYLSGLLSEAKALTELSLLGCALPGAVDLSVHPKLTKLSLITCTAPPGLIDSIAKCEHLKSLHLSNRYDGLPLFNAKNIIHLKCLQHLEELDLRYLMLPELEELQEMAISLSSFTFKLSSAPAIPLRCIRVARHLYDIIREKGFLRDRLVTPQPGF